MRGPGGLATVPPFPSDYRASGWFRMSRRYLRLTESVTWIFGIFVDRSPPSGWPKVVAIASASVSASKGSGL
jgi:hypothetical protein